MSHMSLSGSLLLVLLTGAGGAGATPPHGAAAGATAQPPHRAHHVQRRADRHDAMKTAEERARHVHVLKTVRIVGRHQRPMAVFDINVKPFRFPVGTARYSPRDQHFLPPRGRERW